MMNIIKSLRIPTFIVYIICDVVFHLQGQVEKQSQRFAIHYRILRTITIIICHTVLVGKQRSFVNMP